VSPEAGTGRRPDLDPEVDPARSGRARGAGVLGRSEDHDPDVPPSSERWCWWDPIGNLGDLSPRAVEVLRTPTWSTARTPAHPQAADPRRPHRHLPAVVARAQRGRPDRRGARLVERGGTAAVVSDAGMPGSRTPGAGWWRRPPRPGSGSPWSPAVGGPGRPGGQRPGHRPFLLRGVPARSGRERKERIGKLAGETRTAVLFEAPGRVPPRCGLAQAGDRIARW